MRKLLLKPLITGLFALLPLAVTLWLLGWMFSLVENAVRGIVVNLLNLKQFYVPGVGFLLVLVLAYLAGLLLQTWFARRIWLSVENVLGRLPLIKTVYNSVKDMLGFFTKSSESDAQQVVMVKSPDGAYRLLGFVTRQDFDDLPAGFTEENGETVAVYLPMSYQLGGFTVMIPRAHIEPVDMSVEDALRFAVTAGVRKEEKSLLEEIDTAVTPGEDAAEPQEDPSARA